LKPTPRTGAILVDALVIDRDPALDPFDGGLRHLRLVGEVQLGDAEFPPEAGNLCSVATHAFSPQ
jgi:hypothetical protein